MCVKPSKAFTESDDEPPCVICNHKWLDDTADREKWIDSMLGFSTNVQASREIKPKKLFCPSCSSLGSFS